MSPEATPRIVQGIARAFVATGDLAASRERWEALGFTFGPEEDYAGCRALTARLEGADVCLLACKGNATPGSETPGIPGIAALVKAKAASGGGLVGWSWRVADLAAARGTLSGRGVATEQVTESLAVVDPQRTPGAATLLEECEAAGAIDHPNRVTRTDHIVLMIGDAEAAADAYAEAFGLRPRIERARGRCYAYAKVGASLLEIVGPPAATDQAGSLWGLALISADLDRSSAMAREAGLSSQDPHPAVQGGRILPLPAPVDGVAVAFMER